MLGRLISSLYFIFKIVISLCNVLSLKYNTKLEFYSGNKIILKKEALSFLFLENLKKGYNIIGFLKKIIEKAINKWVYEQIRNI